MANIWIYTLIVVGLCGLMRCEWATHAESKGASGQTVRRCYDDMAKEGDISHLLLDVTSPKEIDHFCSRISRLRRCIADFEHHLSTSENTEYLRKTAGVSIFFLNVCPPGTDLTSKYKGNAPCFHLIKNKILTCGSDLPHLTSYAVKNDLQRKCCLLDHHRECMVKATAESCGPQAAEVMEQLLLRYFRPQSKGCEKNQNCNREIYTRDQDGFYGNEPEVHPGKDWTTVVDCKTTKEWDKDPKIPLGGNASVVTAQFFLLVATSFLSCKFSTW